MEFCRLAPFARGVAVAVPVAVWAVVGCERDDTVSIDRNKPPETFVTQGPLPSDDPESPTLLYYRSHLFWRGEDSDGTVEGFRWAIDDTTDPGAWNFTTRTDSIFRFAVGEVGVEEHLFLIRAVDNEAKQDATPDTLRFESYTRARPVIERDKIVISAVQTTLGSRTDLASGDTVEVFSDVSVCWDGRDDDGFIVAWESKVDSEGDWTVHEVNDKCRAIQGLSPGLHVFNLRAVDDAGAKSSDVTRVFLVSNFDPRTFIDRGSLVATLARPWLPPGSDLVIGPGVAEGDTLPLGATLSLQWSSSDVDGPIVGFQPRFGNIGVPQQDTLSTMGLQAFGGVDTDTTGPLDDMTGFPTPQKLTQTDRLLRGAPFHVKGIDVYGNVEQKPDTLYLRVNFRPSVQFTIPSPTNVVADGTPYDFPFAGADKDSDPTKLKYRWQFSDQPSATDLVDPPETALKVTRSFTQPDAYTLTLWAQDPSGAVRESAPAVLMINAFAPGAHPIGTRRDPGAERGTP